MTAPRDHQPPTANSHQPPTVTNRQPPTATNRQPPTAAIRQRRPTANCQPMPTAANHQSPTTNRRQPPPTATNRQLPTADRQPPPTMVEHMECPQAFLGKLVPEHFFFPVKDHPAVAVPPPLFLDTLVGWPRAPSAHRSVIKSNRCPSPRPGG